MKLENFQIQKNPAAAFNEETITDIPLKASKSTLNTPPPFISGKAINDDLFLSKLSDIDQDIWKFDKEPYVKKKDIHSITIH